MEEIARFALDDGDLTAEFKNQRHGLVSALKRVSRHSLLRGRNTGEDVGTEISETLEYVRTDLAHVVAAAAAVLSNRSGPGRVCQNIESADVC